MVVEKRLLLLLRPCTSVFGSRGMASSISAFSARSASMANCRGTALAFPEGEGRVEKAKSKRWPKLNQCKSCPKGQAALSRS